MPWKDQYKYLQEYIFQQFHFLYNQLISLLPTQSNALCGIYTVLQIIIIKIDIQLIIYNVLKNLGAGNREIGR